MSPAGPAATVLVFATILVIGLPSALARAVVVVALIAGTLLLGMTLENTHPSDRKDNPHA